MKKRPKVTQQSPILINQTGKLGLKVMPFQVSGVAPEFIKLLIQILVYVAQLLPAIIRCKCSWFRCLSVGKCLTLSIQHFSAIVTCMLAAVALCNSANKNRAQSRSVLIQCQFSLQRLVMILGTNATESVFGAGDAS